MRGRKETGSKKGRVGRKEGQCVKVLLCDTEERKKVGDSVMWRFPKAISILWDKVTPLIQQTDIYVHVFLQMCQKKEQFFPPRLLTHLFLYSLRTARSQQSYVRYCSKHSAYRWFEPMYIGFSHVYRCDRYHRWGTF